MAEPYITLRSAIKPQLGVNVWRDDYNGSTYYKLQFFSEYTNRQTGEIKQSGLISISDSFVYDELRAEVLATIRKLTQNVKDVVRANTQTQPAAAITPVPFTDDDIPF